MEEKVQGAWLRERELHRGTLPPERLPGEVATSYLRWKRLAPVGSGQRGFVLLADSEAAPSVPEGICTHKPRVWSKRNQDSGSLFIVNK